MKKRLEIGDPKKADPVGKSASGAEACPDVSLDFTSRGTQEMARPMTLEIIPLLFLAGMAAGFIDSIAGGGGLISVPALLWAGLPPQMALGTNKMQSSFGTAIAVQKYAKAGLITWREVRLAVFVTFAFALLGAWTLTRVSNGALKPIIPWMLMGAAVYVLISPRLAKHGGRFRLGLAAFSLLGGSLLGFYDGFFGPGTGAFWTIACLSLHGMELTRATAFTKVVNLTSNVASLLVFIALSRVDYGIAAAMIAGQLIGGRLGAGMAIRHGAPFIRVAFIAVVIAMVAKLLWDQFSGGSGDRSLFRDPEIPRTETEGEEDPVQLLANLGGKITEARGMPALCDLVDARHSSRRPRYSP